MNTILQRTNRTLEFGLTNVLQIMPASSISTHMSFTRGFFLEMEVRMTFLYEKQFQKITPFFTELMELYNSASVTFYQLCWGMLFPDTFFTRGFYLEKEIRITFLYEKQFQQMTPFSKKLIELYNSA